VYRGRPFVILSPVPGRLFVVRSDLTRITCDAWLLPTDPWLNVTKQWLSILPSELRHPDEFRRAAPKAFGRDRHTFAVEASSPVAVATSIGGLSLDAILKNVREFLDLALEMRPVSTVRGRKVPLFALPLVGTGRGGWSRSKGDVVGDVVAATSEWAAAHEADACLVVDSAQAFAAAQSARRQLRADRSLPPRLRPTAQALGARAALGRLVLFVGAGVGIPAGLPDWMTLLEKLADDAELRPDEQRALKKLDPLDAARIIEVRLGDNALSMADAISPHVHATRFALAHALLASLPVSEVVTTNYDVLFEQASTAAGRKLAVLPYDPPYGDGWLLKLHGCIVRARGDIVLTRGDYLRYADRRAALAGIVQALLITRTMLFVGFSLTDPNFHRIVDDVRKAVRTGGEAIRDAFGTALLLEDRPLLHELWSPDVELLAVAKSPSSGGRTLDLFLDEMVGAASTSAEHLLDPTFAGALDEGEAALADALRSFEAQLPPRAKSAPAWAVVADALSRLGRAAEHAP